MPRMTLGELADASGGVLVRGDRSTIVGQYDIDSRRLGADSVFFALEGEHTDGHLFLGDARQRGATAAVVARNEGAADAPEGLILVQDVDEALWYCGRAAREKLSGVRRVAITGSNGKTSTKELLSAALSASAVVHKTPGNFNNQLGVPLSLLACPDDAEVMVLELAMSGPGEIAALGELVDPDVGIVTNVRAVHLEFFGSLDDIAAAKGELYAVLRDDATAVYNIDNPHLRVQVTRHVGPQVSFGRAENADVQILDLANRFEPGVSLLAAVGDQQHTIHLGVGGAHSAFNAIAALAGLIALDVPLQPAIERMQEVRPGVGRCRVTHMGREIVVVDDTYNSSPAALASVMETLRVSEPTGRRVLVMGDMLELGAVGGALHREAGKRAASAGIGLLVSVGSLARQAAETARRGGVEEVHHYPDADEAADALPALIDRGDLVVVKGSRSVHLERVVAALIAEFGEES